MKQHPPSTTESLNGTFVASPEFFEMCRSIVNNGQFFGTRVCARFKIEGIHRWAKCPIEEVSFLRDYHRHVFHVICTKSVYHDDRDVEFIQLSHDIQKYLNDRYYSDQYKCLFFDDMSCEMIANELLQKFNLNGCEVNEDGEGGAIVGTI